jgi:ATP diphosphatase
VFGSSALRSANEQSASWEAQKHAERARRSENGTLAGVPTGLPALTRAAKLTARAARVGFDWPDAKQVLLKLDEEVAELRAELPDAKHERLEDEVGDLLFVLANLARKLDLDPEACLRHANLKFHDRFNKMEQGIASGGYVLTEMPLEQMEEEWQNIKKNL